MSEQKKYTQEDIERFMAEREKVRGIVEKIGGQSSNRERIINGVFITLVIISFSLAPFFEGAYRWIFIDIAILLVSLKLSFLIHNEMKVNHFQFWILTSLEWKVNEISKEVKEIKKQLNKDEKQDN